VSRLGQIIRARVSLGWGGARARGGVLLSGLGPTLPTVSSFRSQHRHPLSNGVVVERLPLGFAAGRWWASFVGAGPGRDGREPPIDPRIVMSSAHVHDPDGLLNPIRGGGGGSEHEFSHTWELVDHGASRARVSYTEDGVETGSELLMLDPTDRAGYFAVRLTDGSLVERLPIGHAHGMWRLYWVRSDVPVAETEVGNEETDMAMPHERFVRFRSSAGPIELVGALGAIGGAVQPFSVQLPDMLTHLEVDYLVENEVVDTELLPLPGLQNRAPM
jgi:hypothetical protein